MKNIAIITAAGLGTRMGIGTPKQYLELAGKPIICHTLERFEAAKLVDGIILVSDSPSIPLINDKILKDWPCKKIIKVVAGGEKRQDSVFAGLSAVPDSCQVALVHDGVRPFISPLLIDKSIDEAAEHGACIVAIPLKDTIKRVDEEGFIAETVERAGLWRAQTPQTFKVEILREAFKKATAEKFYGTDEAMLVERTGHEIVILAGGERNIKITSPEDLVIAQSMSLRLSAGFLEEGA